MRSWVGAWEVAKDLGLEEGEASELLEVFGVRRCGETVILWERREAERVMGLWAATREGDERSRRVENPSEPYHTGNAVRKARKSGAAHYRPRG